MDHRILALFCVALLPATAAANGLCTTYPGFPPGSAAADGMVRIDAGSFLMGSEARPYRPEEGPVRQVDVAAFWIDRHEVTNAQFRAFVEATGYRTLAETGLDQATNPDLPDWLRQPGAMVFSPPREVRGLDDVSQWWRYVPGANWREPLGPGSSVAKLGNHPVVHIAYEDALAYARWKGGDLPTEAEWEYAARGGLEGADYTWGEAYDPVNGWKANTWQGEFPKKNNRLDGWRITAPVGCYEPNGFGLYDMAGNVWEYVSDGWTPRPDTLAAPEDARVTIKGGSWLCTPIYCGRYRPAARQPQEKSLGTNHIGFRTVRRVDARPTTRGSD
ncbi:MAG: formylglycine-generating enzyme family protein [Pseudomonadota bacterium]